MAKAGTRKKQCPVHPHSRWRTISPCCRALSMIGWSVSPPRRRKMPPRAGSSAIPHAPSRRPRSRAAKAVADRLANGDNAVRVIREWRDMIQGELAAAVGISQNYLSEIETGRPQRARRICSGNSPARWAVPIDLLIE